MTLFPHQEEGIEWLIQGKTRLLADEMGLGKTIMAVVGAARITAQNVLILCPAVAVENWRNEFKAWWPAEVPRPKDMTVCPYSQVNRLVAEDWDLAILDEVHFLKSTDAQRTQVVFGKNGLLRRVKRVWALSGTPVPNHAAEIWPMAYTFGWTKLPYEAFVDRYCVTREFRIGNALRKKRVVGTRPDRIPELQETLRPHMLRRRQDEVLDLPPIHFSEVVVDPCEVDLGIDSSFIKYVFPADNRAEFFDQLERERDILQAVLDQDGTSEDKQKGLQAVMNSVASLRRYTGLQKMNAIAEMVSNELRSGDYEKIVIFCIHQGVVQGLQERLKKFKPVVLFGGTPAHKRQFVVEKFQKQKSCRVFIGNIQAAGTAITLTSANQVLFAELDWVPGNNNQAAYRCRRIGQKKPVFVRFVAVAGSIDQKIAGLLRRKSVEIGRLIDGEPMEDDTELAELREELLSL